MRCIEERSKVRALFVGRFHCEVHKAREGRGFTELSIDSRAHVSSKWWLFRAGLLGLCLWLLVGTLRIHPSYLAYFNEFWGGPANGYKYLVDSNLDWGQDLKNLAAYMRRSGLEKIKLEYYGPSDPRIYGITYEPLRPGQPTAGTVAISVTFLQGLYQCRGATGCYSDPICLRAFNWLKQYEPIAKIGYSIFVYQIPGSQPLPPTMSLPPQCFVDIRSQSSRGGHGD